MSLAVVQTTDNFAANSGGGITGTITFGANVTVGNLLVVLARVRDSAVPAAATGWNVDPTTIHGAANADYYAVYWRYAQAGDTTGFTYDSTSRIYAIATAWEISGVSGTWASDMVSIHGDGAVFSNFSGSYVYTTTGFTTSNANDLVLSFHSNVTGSPNGQSSVYTASGVGTASVDKNHGWNTPAATWFGSTLFGNTLGLRESVAGSGTTVSESITGNGGAAITSSFVGYIILELKGPASSTETATVAMHLGGVSFSAAGVRQEAATVAVHLSGVAYNVQAQFIAETVHVTMSLNGVTIAAFGSDLSGLTKLRQFHTFG